MTEDQLRAVVRDAIARYAAHPPVPAAPSPGVVPRHASHAVFAVPAGADTDGSCVIEPTVACTHCGFCKSYGH
jgi:hypothetical protein